MDIDLVDTNTFLEGCIGKKYDTYNDKQEEFKHCFLSRLSSLCEYHPNKNGEQIYRFASSNKTNPTCESTDYNVFYLSSLSKWSCFFVGCIIGDEVDGVPGIQHVAPGFGRKTALKLLKKHGSLENLLNAAAVRTVGRQYAQDALTKYADYLRRNHKVLALRR